MIQTVFHISVLRLLNNKHELLLIFLVPILFFSIFALIFSRGVGQTRKQVHVAFINDDQGDAAAKIIRQVVARPELTPLKRIGTTTPDWPLNRLSRALISQHNVDVVVYFPPSFSFPPMVSAPPAIQVVNEGSDPISSQVVHALLAQAVAIESARQRPQPFSQVFLASATRAPHPVANAGGQQRTATIEDLNIFAANKQQPKIAMYAAGIAVMFLLFSANGAGASLLEEREAGTLERLLTSQLSISQLLLGKWLYIATLGFVQTSTMFVWGQLVFGVDLVGHWPGFALMALATTSATASFALFLATLCRTRNQLNGVSVVLVLSMSAIGGSMIPRYIMSESMQRLGRYTFNGWALDGFQKIFWYDLPVSAIKTEFLVLCSMALLFGLCARVLAQKWSVA